MRQVVSVVYSSAALVMAVLFAACTAPLPVPPDVGTPLATQALTPTIELASTGIELAWKTKLDAEINWAPALLTIDNRTLLIIASEASRVLAPEPDTGTEVWQFTPPGQLWTDSITVVGDAVFVATEGAQVHLLDGLTGSMRWQTSVQASTGPTLDGLEARSKPALSNNVLYIPTAGVGSRAKVTNFQISAPLVAVDFETGTERWRFDSGNYILRAPFLFYACSAI
jgi:outer membrane protein assembly factor BamB